MSTTTSPFDDATSTSTSLTIVPLGTIIDNTNNEADDNNNATLSVILYIEIVGTIVKRKVIDVVSQYLVSMYNSNTQSSNLKTIVLTEESTSENILSPTILRPIILYKLQGAAIFVTNNDDDDFVPTRLEMEQILRSMIRNSDSNDTLANAMKQSSRAVDAVRMSLEPFDTTTTTTTTNDYLIDTNDNSPSSSTNSNTIIPTFQPVPTTTQAPVASSSSRDVIDNNNNVDDNTNSGNNDDDRSTDSAESPQDDNGHTVVELVQLEPFTIRLELSKALNENEILPIFRLDSIVQDIITESVRSQLNDTDDYGIFDTILLFRSSTIPTTSAAADAVTTTTPTNSNRNRYLTTTTTTTTTKENNNNNHTKSRRQQQVLTVLEQLQYTGSAVFTRNTATQQPIPKTTVVDTLKTVLLLNDDDRSTTTSTSSIYTDITTQLQQEFPVLLDDLIGVSARIPAITASTPSPPIVPSSTFFITNAPSPIPTTFQPITIVPSQQQPISSNIFNGDDTSENATGFELEPRQNSTTTNTLAPTTTATTLAPTPVIDDDEDSSSSSSSSGSSSSSSSDATIDTPEPTVSLPPSLPPQEPKPPPAPPSSGSRSAYSFAPSARRRILNTSVPTSSSPSLLILVVLLLSSFGHKLRIW